MAKTPDWITDVRFYETQPKGDRGPEARGSLTVADALYTQFTVWKNRDGGLQVTLPRKANPNFNSDEAYSKTNKKYYEDVGCCSGDIREEMNSHIVDRLIAERGGSTTADDDDGNPIPF